MNQPTRPNFASNSPFEAIAGFSRAVRVRDQVVVAGTVGWRDDQTLPDGASAQMQQAIANIETALTRAWRSLRIRITSGISSPTRAPTNNELRIRTGR